MPAPDSTAIVRLTNDGTIQGGSRSYGGSVNLDLLTNHGRMLGDILLDAGNDLFDNRGGTVRGEIFGGDGHDRFLPGRGAETIFGSDGHDTLDFRTSGALRVSLADDSGTGRAAGDSYASIERVLGSRNGDDTLIGDDIATTFVGGGGHDRLRGGGGNDAFEYCKASEGGDKVLDFRGSAGDDDLFRIDASGFGGGLAAGVLDPGRFRTRNDNDAQDGNDRFIFRRTDETLWFDRDGNRSGDAVLIADLQDGATVTSADILLV